MAPPPKKKRKVDAKIEEITFNTEERQDYLSGFHKRKVARQKQAKAEAIKREREELLAARKIIRNNRKKELEEHVEAINTVLKNNQGVESDHSSDVEGVEGMQEEREEVDREEEYVDDDKFTTVTVEAVDVDRDGLHVMKEQDDGEKEKGTTVGGKKDEDASNAEQPTRDANGKRIWSKQRPKSLKTKTKTKKFKYESKADRKVTRFKEHRKGKTQAKERKSK